MNESEPDPVDPDVTGAPPWSAPTTDREISTPQEPEGRSRLAWGPWATIGWTLLCIVVMFGAQIVGVIIFIAVQGCHDWQPENRRPRHQRQSPVHSRPYSVLRPRSGWLRFLIWLRRYPIRDYLALHWPPARSVLIALSGLAVLLVATDLTSYLLGRPLVPTVMVDVYRTAWLPAFVCLCGARSRGRGDAFSRISLHGHRRLASRARRGDHRQLGRLCFSCTFNMIGTGSSLSRRSGFTWASSAFGRSRCS